jgi:hypothetical protein
MHSVASHEDPALKPNKTAEPPIDDDPMQGAVGKLDGATAVATGILGAV